MEITLEKIELVKDRTGVSLQRGRLKPLMAVLSTPSLRSRKRSM